MVDQIVVAAPDSLLSEASRILERVAFRTLTDPARLRAVVGGADRVESVGLALDAAGECTYVLVHDAARCVTPPEVYHRVHAALLAGASAVVPVLPMTDTVRSLAAKDPEPSPAEASAGSSTPAAVPASVGPEAGALGELLVGDVDRTVLRRIQTPQGFPAEVLREAHARARSTGASATDDASLVEDLGLPVCGVPGDERALKITYPIDLRIAELYSAESEE